METDSPEPYKVKIYKDGNEVSGLQAGWQLLSMDANETDPSPLYSDYPVGPPNLNAVGAIRLDVDTKNTSDTYNAGDVIMDYWFLTDNANVANRGPDWDTGKFGQTLNFDGNGDTVWVPHSASINLTGNFAIEAWINPTSPLQTGTIFYKYDDTTKGYDLQLYSDGRLRAKVGETWYYSIGTVPTDTWTHVVVSLYKGTLYYYINGQPAGNSSSGLAPNSWGGEAALGSPDRGSFFYGLLDEVVIYNRGLVAEEAVGRYGVSLQSAVADDTSGAGGGSQSGDTVVITFSGGTQGNEINSGNIDTALALSSGSWVDGPNDISAAWSDDSNTNDTLTFSNITGQPTIAPGGYHHFGWQHQG